MTGQRRHILAPLSGLLILLLLPTAAGAAQVRVSCSVDDTLSDLARYFERPASNGAVVYHYDGFTITIAVSGSGCRSNVSVSATDRSGKRADSVQAWAIEEVRKAVRCDEASCIERAQAEEARQTESRRHQEAVAGRKKELEGVLWHLFDWPEGLARCQAQLERDFAENPDGSPTESIRAKLGISRAKIADGVQEVIETIAATQDRIAPILLGDRFAFPIRRTGQETFPIRVDLDGVDAATIADAVAITRNAKLEAHTAFESCQAMRKVLAPWEERCTYDVSHCVECVEYRSQEASRRCKMEYEMCVDLAKSSPECRWEPLLVPLY